MIEGGVSKSGRRDKGMADRISASIILQSWLKGLENKKQELNFI
jgi:RNase H-fold protein (predicted Holliday junction resolvase)